MLCIKTTVHILLTQNTSKSSITITRFPHFNFLTTTCCYVKCSPSGHCLLAEAGCSFYCLRFPVWPLLKKVPSALTVALLISEMQGERTGGHTTKKRTAISINNGYKCCFFKNTWAVQYLQNIVFMWEKEMCLLIFSFATQLLWLETCQISDLPCDWWLDFFFFVHIPEQFYLNSIFSRKKIK